MLIAFMALAVPLTTSALGLASTLSLDSMAKMRILKRQYSGFGGSAHAMYRLLHEQTADPEGGPDPVMWRDTLEFGTPEAYSLALNEGSLDITVEKLSEPKGTPSVSATSHFRKLRTSKAADKATASPGEVITYTVTVENLFDEPAPLTKVHDGLPPGFSYVSTSTSGVTTNEPDITPHQGSGSDPGFDELTWDLTSLDLTLQPLESVALIFRATASASDGNYCNEAWVDPGGITLTGTGATDPAQAKVTVGSPPDSLCPGEAARVSKTVVTPDGLDVVPSDTPTVFTYTISIENTGADPLSIPRVVDQLPEGFSYVDDSISGDFTSATLNGWGSCWGIWCWFFATLWEVASGRQGDVLIWTLDPPILIPAGDTTEVVFEADATVGGGVYWNDAWAFYGSDFEDRIYTWPTAPVYAMDVFEITATYDGKSVTLEVWVTEGLHFVVRQHVGG